MHKKEKKHLYHHIFIRGNMLRDTCALIFEHSIIFLIPRSFTPELRDDIVRIKFRTKVKLLQ